jgi:LacI family transcriptional regulator
LSSQDRRPVGAWDLQLTARPTIRDVAREAGVSTVTVSRVVNTPALVKPSTRTSVEAVMQRLGYAPNAAAQSMRTRVSRTIGFLVPDLTNYPNAAVAKAAEAALAEAGYYMLLTDSDYDAGRERRFLTLLRSRQVDGIILYLSDEDDPSLHATLGNLDIPVVALDRTLPLPLDVVFSEHGPAMRRTVEHLIGQGHRRLGVVVPDLRIRPVRERIRAFREAAAASGMDPDDQIIVFADPKAPPAEAIARALAPKPGPSALLIDGSHLLAAAFEVLCRRRLKVPDDVALVAIDAVEPLAAAMPEVIGIARDFVEIGARAARLMVERLVGARTGPPVVVTLPSRCVMAERAAGRRPRIPA